MIRQSLLIACLALLAGCHSNLTYDYACPTPLKHWWTRSAGVDHHAVIWRIEIDGKGALVWNSMGTDEKEISRYLKIGRSLNPRPFVILAPAPDAPCDRVHTVRALIDANYCGDGFRCGEGRGYWQPSMFGPPETWKLFG
jgi:hypothetical protein